MSLVRVPTKTGCQKDGYVIRWDRVFADLFDSPAVEQKPIQMAPPAKLDTDPETNPVTSATLISLGIIADDLRDLRSRLCTQKWSPLTAVVLELIDIVARLEQRPSAKIEFTPTPGWPVPAGGPNPGTVPTSIPYFPQPPNYQNLGDDGRVP